MLYFQEKSVFLKFCQYLGSDFSINTEKSVYLEAMCMLHFPLHVYRKCKLIEETGKKSYRTCNHCQGKVHTIYE